MTFKVGILVVSDSCYQDRTQDRTGPAMESFFECAGREDRPDEHSYRLYKRQIVPDNVADIQRTILDWSSPAENVRLIITCGGTGFTQHDVTPEAVSTLITRPAPGIVHAMLTESLRKTPYAIMSRPVAGVVNNSLIITLPGSPTGARENLGAVFSTLSHALAQLESENSRALHMKMARTVHDEKPGTIVTNAGHSHDHHSHDHHSHAIARHTLISNDLSAPVTERARKSPFPMISIREAIMLISEKTPAAEIVEVNISDPRFIGSVVAKQIRSPVAVPSFRASIVDGYAVNSSDGTGIYPVCGSSLASTTNDAEFILKPGQIARITTGAPVPTGADAVIMVEETELVKVSNDEEEEQVRILAEGVKPGDNIRKIGSDLAKGSVIFDQGYKITNPGEIGMLASVGISKIPVYRKPIVAVLSSGDELKDCSKEGFGKYGEVYDCNRPALIGMVRRLGYECIDMGIVHDTEDEIRNALDGIIKKDQVDYVITSGGVSMGEKDFLKSIIERDLHGEIHFGRVRMKPGKPTTFATVGNKTIFALPGNPASALTALLVFVLPSLLKFQGLSGKSADKTKLAGLPVILTKLKAPFKLDSERPEYQRVHIAQDLTGNFEASSTGMQRSSRIGSFKQANALLCLPSASDYGSSTVDQGSMVEALVFGEISR